MSVAREIETKLRDTFAPTRLVVTDESEQHRGHAGWREGGETHFHVDIAAPAFKGLSRVERSRAVHRALAAELDGPVHALRLTIAAE